MSESPKILIVHETIMESVISDAFTFGALIISVFIGWFIGSEALQWIAGLILIMGVIGRGVGRMKKHLTIAEARAELDRLEAEFKEGK